MNHTYRVLVRATGLRRIIDGVDCAVGVFGTEFVTADSQEAVAVAIQELRARLTSNGTMTDQTTFQVEEVQEISPGDIPKIKPGLAFYRE